MRWAGEGREIRAETPVGDFVIVRLTFGAGDRFEATWAPNWGAYGSVLLGRYQTAGAAKGACKRYAKRMAAAFKAMGKAGWQ